jgi:AcrR family transcriptional regulator
LPHRPKAVFEPRKSPVQARSAASVKAILEATVQVLLSAGKERLTTTNVAQRAGVSVGTLYQYFPNKKALLQAVLKDHLSQVADAVEQACREQAGQSPRPMVSALISAFLKAKLKDARTSAALYSVSSDVDGARIAQQMGTRLNKAMTRMLASALPPLATEPLLVATMLQGLITGVSRRILESNVHGDELDRLCNELIFMACAYVDASSLVIASPRSSRKTVSAASLNPRIEVDRPRVRLMPV